MFFFFNDKLPRVLFFSCQLSHAYQCDMTWSVQLTLRIGSTVEYQYGTSGLTRNVTLFVFFCCSPHIPRRLPLTRPHQTMDDYRTHERRKNKSMTAKKKREFNGGFTSKHVRAHQRAQQLNLEGRRRSSTAVDPVLVEAEKKTKTTKSNNNNKDGRKGRKKNK